MGAGLWHVVRHVRVLTVLLDVAQRLLFRGLAVLQYVNDFPVRVQFRRTTQRFLSVMNTTEEYATYVDAAASLDHYCGVAQWAQEAPPISVCDAVGLLVDATAAQQLVATSNVAGMEVFLSSLLKRNAHGLMDPSIYNYFNCAKYCIEDYTRAMESLVRAYAAAGDSSERTATTATSSAADTSGQEKSAKSATDLQPLRTCWVRTDALAQHGGDAAATAAPATPFTLHWEAMRATTAAAAAGNGGSTAAALAAGVLPSTSSAILPAVDITARIRHVWRRTSSEHALLTAAAAAAAARRTTPPLAAQSPPRRTPLSRQASASTDHLPRLNSAVSTAAPASDSVGGALGVAKNSSRFLFGSASAGEESNYLTEDEAPSGSAGSAGDPPTVRTAARRATSDNWSSCTSFLLSKLGDTALYAARRPAAKKEVARDATHAAATLPNTEHSLLSHIEGSCAALHRFMDGYVSSPLPTGAVQPSPHSTQRRVRVLRQVLHSFGRTALVLSGGASMGTYHAGVARALYEAGVMPDILCGSSAGSIIAAMICTKTPAELRSFMQSDVLSTEAMQMSPFGEDASLAEKLRRFLKTGFLMDVRTLMECMRGQCGDLTFLEAYELSGRVLNVSVTRSQQEGTHADRHALLNYVTSPDVVIWSAVSASCALPGLFTAVQLIEKPPSAGGTFAPYLPGELWCDGSVAQDIPRRLLTQLFDVDYLIVSQVNPYVIPFLKHPRSHLVVASGSSLVSRVWFAMVAVWAWVLTVLFSLRLLPRRGAGEVLFLAFAQDYGGDVTVYPVESLLTATPDYLNLVNNPSAEYISYVASRAQCRTWPLVTRIRLVTTIERCLLQELRRLEMTSFVEKKGVGL